jgi:asparagine synthase (glutamine-hydrolysing)
MCGIAGLISPNPQNLEARINAMTHALAHRGPDGQGIWIDEGAGLALGHARLAIRDLSPAGAQPMASACQRFVLTYNGELYNADELKADLVGRTWRSTSDSEILLEHCAAFGIERTLAAANGMFAFALWDRLERKLVLARDRFGIKPLYWAMCGNDFLFGSELRALSGDGALARDLNPQALAAFVRLGYVPDPLSIWTSAHKLEAGTLLILSPGAAPVIRRWWDAKNEILNAAARQGKVSQTELVLETSALLADAVKRQMVADVPVGVFLSGGVDSSAVASHVEGQLDSFTVSFGEAGYDESAHAKAIADHLGLCHHELRLGSAEALATVPKLASLYDEPFADSSQIPTYLISRFAKESVKVVLSGDGGDEMFAGYNRHRFIAQDWPRMRAYPLALRRVLAGAIRVLPPGLWGALGEVAGQKLLGEKLQKLAGVLPLDSSGDIYDCLAGQGLSLEESPLAFTGPSPYLVSPFPPPDMDLHPLDRMQLQDIRHYLPGDILTKTDRASMAVGLEVRVPLLDHRLLGPAFAAAPLARFQHKQGKALLRAALARRLPTHLFENRPKQGFAVPIDEWLKGPLQAWAGDLLGRAKSSGLFDAKRIDDWWRQHQSGQKKRHHALWNLLMFQSWREGL